MDSKYDVVIVGGGIIGLAHAYFSIQKGLKVLLIEREEFAVGASVRNFGLVWPIGQPPGNLYDRAMNSRETWLELSKKAGFWALESGSFHLAYHPKELKVIQEYHEKFGNKTHLLSADEVLKKAPNIAENGLLGGLFSETEVNVNAKAAIHSIAKWLGDQDLCTIKFGEQVQQVETGMVNTTKGKYTADKVLVCSGSDFQTLFPEVFADSPLIKSKLQMMRSMAQNPDFKLGPVLCGGLTLRHYASFDQCESLQDYKDFISANFPQFDKWGIHVMVSQNEHNELIIGDSHEYGQTFDPFNKQEINDIILNYLKGFVEIPNMSMLENWHGVYAKNPEGTEFVAEPMNGVKIITGFGGAGMTFSFGYAREEVGSW